MERGLFIGGVLICGSIALAILLNLSGGDALPVPPAVPLSPPAQAPVERATSHAEMSPADCEVIAVPAAEPALDGSRTPELISCQAPVLNPDP